MPRSLKLACSAGLGLGLALAGATDANAAAVETVTSQADSGLGTLRRAVIDVDPGGTVNFAGGVTGEITLTSGEIGFSKALTIVGPGADVLTVSGNGSSRIFKADTANGLEVTIAGLALTDGDSGFNDGGAILSRRADLTLDRMVLSGNDSGADGGGVAVINPSSDSPNADLTVRNSTISGNTASGRGGGIYSLYTPADIIDSTVSANSGAQRGGGIGSYQNPAREKITITGSTIAGNDATSEGGGVWAYSKTNSHSEIRSSLVDENTAPVEPDLSNYIVATGGFDVSFSLIGDPTGAEITNNGNNILHQSALLGPLADNGGPTATQLPPINSPVIDQGIADGVTLDQRGQPRTVDQPGIPNAADGTDMGAAELGDLTPPTTMITSGPADGSTVDTTSVSFAFSADESATFECSLDGATFTPCISPKAYDNLAAGPHTFKVRATDDAGNQGSTVQRAFTFQPAADCNGTPATIVAMAGVPTVGTDGDNVIVGTEGDDVINSLGGDDQICANGGDDVIRAGGGDDAVDGRDGDDQIHGEGGADRLFGSGGADRLLGGSGDDELRGGRDEDMLKGRAGDDELLGRGGEDTLIGNGGDDKLQGNGDSDTVRGGGGNDEIRGLQGKDDLHGSGGDDRIFANNGNDRLAGGPGDDRLDGGSGNNRCNGGPGHNELSSCG